MASLFSAVEVGVIAPGRMLHPIIHRLTMTWEKHFYREQPFYIDDEKKGM